MAAPMTQAARERDQPRPSMADATTTSRSEIAEVRAPTISAPKKSVPTTRPTPPISAKAWGSVMKSAPTVLAPTSADSSSAKIIGNTTKPAMNAMAMSAPAMITAALGRLTSRPR